MLKTLTVWNFALLEHVKIEFGAGLNIIRMAMRTRCRRGYHV